MTDEQWKQYKEASPHFESAKHNFVRNAPRFLTEQTIRIYEDVTGRTMLYHDLSCAVCVLHIYQTAAKLYFDELAHRNKLAYDEEQKNRQQIENEKVDNTKPDSGNKEKAPRDNGANKKRNAKVKNNKRASKKA